MFVCLVGLDGGCFGSVFEVCFGCGVRCVFVVVLVVVFGVCFDGGVWCVFGSVSGSVW